MVNLAHLFHLQNASSIGARDFGESLYSGSIQYVVGKTKFFSSQLFWTHYHKRM
jgi:hypothetical protein